MKKVLMTMTLLLALAMGVQAAAQKHRHTPREQEELVDTTSKNAVEAYSDTTSAAQTATMDAWDDDADSDEHFEDIFDRKVSGIVDRWDSKDTLGVIMVLGVLFIIFVLAPILIIAALFYFINKNRKQRLKLAQMAVEQGQPIPEQLLDDQSDVTDEYQKGLRQCFVGVGLMIFLGLVAEEVGFGIGALVFCIGLGKIVAAKTAEKKENNVTTDLTNSNYDKETLS